MSHKVINIGSLVLKEIDRLGLQGFEEGAPLKLLGYQEDFIKNIFLYDFDGSRLTQKYTDAAIITGKGWGKTPLLALLGLLLLGGNTEAVINEDNNIELVNRNQDVYVLSNTATQAEGVMNNAKMMLGRDNDFFDVRKDFIRCKNTNKIMKIIPLSSSVEGLVGSWIIDQSESMTSERAKKAYYTIRRNALKNHKSFLIQSPNTPEITTLSITKNVYDNVGTSVAELLLNNAKTDDRVYVDERKWGGSIDSLKDKNGKIILNNVKAALREYYAPVLEDNGGHFNSDNIDNIAKEFDNNFVESSRFFLGVASGLGEHSFMLPDQVEQLIVDHYEPDKSDDNIVKILSFDGSYGRRGGDSLQTLYRRPDSTSIVITYYDLRDKSVVMKEYYREDPPSIERDTAGWQPDREKTIDILCDILLNDDISLFIYDESGWETDIERLKDLVDNRTIVKKFMPFYYTGNNNVVLSDALLDLRELMITSSAGGLSSHKFFDKINVVKGKFCDDFFNADVVKRKYGYALSKKSRFGSKIDGAQAGLLGFYGLNYCINKKDFLNDGGSAIIVVDSSSVFDII